MVHVAGAELLSERRQPPFQPLPLVPIPVRGFEFEIQSAEFVIEGSAVQAISHLICTGPFIAFRVSGFGVWLDVSSSHPCSLSHLRRSLPGVSYLRLTDFCVTQL